MKTTAEQRTAIERYIIDCIDTSGYDDIQRSERDRLKFVLETFQREYAEHQLRYHDGNMQATFVGWLQGLPSVFNIDFENYRILELGRQWGILPAMESDSVLDKRLAKMIERKEESFLKNWWGKIYMIFTGMLKRTDPAPVKKAERKTRDEYQIQGYYGSWEVVTTEDTFKDARERLKEYRDNEKDTSFRVVKKRVKLEPKAA